MISTKTVSRRLFAVFTLILLNLTCVPAPVPRCSFFIVINKLSEYSNILSDANPYFPVPPCEYGGPWQAIRAGDYESVFILSRPDKLLRHNFYELLWLIRKGAARIGRIWRGQEPFISDENILHEGYKHYTPYVRVRQIGTNSYRQPEIIDNPRLYQKVIAQNLREIRGGGRGHGHPPEVANIRPYGRPKRKIPHHEDPYYTKEEPVEEEFDPSEFPIEEPHYHQEGSYHQTYQINNPDPQFKLIESQETYPDTSARSFQTLQPNRGRVYEGGFFPGHAPDVNQEQVEAVQHEEVREASARSDPVFSEPADHSDFRPHQRVFRTKVLDTPSVPESEFGQRISKKKSN